MSHRRALFLAGIATAALVAALSGGLAQETVRRKGFSVKVTSPANGEIVLGRTKITAEVKIDKPEAIEKVEFYVGDTLVFVDQEVPYECWYDFGNEAKERVIRAVAYHREEITVSDFVVTRKLELSFAVKVNRVLLTAAVFDKEGNFVTGLDKSAFVLLEDGRSREILEFSPESRPILMGILIDVSGSMQEKMDEAQKAACGFVDSLQEQDRAMLVEFNEKVYMLSDMSNDREHLKKLIRSVKALGGTAIYDAVHVTLRRLRHREARKAIVILSDGEDTQSTLDYKKVLEEAKANDVTIYGIALGAGFRDAGASGQLKELAEQTGGRAFSASKVSQLEGIYSKIADELRSQYALAYASDNDRFDGRWIPIKLEAKTKGLEVRARKGYFALAPPGS